MRGKRVIAFLLAMMMICLSNSGLSVEAATYTMTDSATDTTDGTVGTYQMKTKVDITSPPTLYWTTYSNGSYAKLSYSKNGTSYKAAIKNNKVEATIRAVGFSSISTDGFEFGLFSNTETISCDTKNLSYSLYGVAYGGLYSYQEVAQVKYALKKNNRNRSTVVLTVSTGYGF